MRIAAFTDIHAMSSTLDSALSAARREGFDMLLILGDLLTYGVTPRETLDIVQDAITRHHAVLLTGNHDAMYLDQADGYAASLPEWLRETVAWTAGQIPAKAMTLFDWHENWSIGPLFAAHANPYGSHDWRSIHDVETAEAAATTLAARGYRYGLFGHTHRARRFNCDAASIFTLGSLGQPRDNCDRRLQWAMVEVHDDRVTVSSRALPFDRAGHVAAIRSTALSQATQDRLCGFFA